MGVTWLLAIYSLWKAKFGENVKVLFLSQGEEEAKDVISKCKFIDNHLPDFIRSKRDPDSTDFIGFPDQGSEIRALPSTEKAGRSTDATLVVCDEWEFHPYAEQNFAALKPTIDAGGQFVGMSTADKTKLKTFFKVKYRGAMAGTSSFHKIFLSWKERPGRDGAWLNEVSKDLSDWQREQEYPETESEALDVLKTRRYFDIDALKQMPDIKPIPHELSGKYHGLYIYRLPVTGRKYCVFTDPSDGKEDPHGTIVRDHNTGEWVAVSHTMVPADESARRHDELCRLYNNAWNSYELNSRAGGIFSEKISHLGTPNQCPFVDTNGALKTDGKKGWWTGKNLKEKMRLSLEEHLRLRLDTIYDRGCIEELLQYIQPEGEDPQAPQGGHDDIVMAGGGVIMIDKYLPAGAGTVQSTHLKERW